MNPNHIQQHPRTAGRVIPAHRDTTGGPPGRPR
jgi:hypothetical protein